jgi:arginyl-tRNA synthetase
MDRTVREAVTAALGKAFPGEDLSDVEVEVEIPRDPAHGDHATNVAMTLARRLKRAPRQIAEALAAEMRADEANFASVEVAGPGFLNVRIAPAVLHRGLAAALAAGDAWGNSDAGGGRRIQVEFVSANPTGPMNVVNARAAAFGGTLTRMLAAAGYDAAAEFYVNDVGGQIDLLGETVLARYRQRKGEDAAIPEQGYQGQYLVDLVAELDEAETDALLAGKDDAERAAALAPVAVDHMCAWQKRDLAAYGTRFDRWFHQRELYPAAVDRTLATLQEKDLVYAKDDALWFRSTDFGDDQDRVVRRSNGEYTYFLADLAYHHDKHVRGFGRVVDVWGPDHHGYIGRMQAGVQALGLGEDWLEILIVQQVNLLAGGQPVKMSKRKGEFITLRELIDEVGKDSAVFFFLMRRAESHLDFDMDLARQESDENPVFYVKYAHARIAGILRKAGEEGVERPAEPALDRLTDPRELDLIKTLLRFPGLVAGAAAEREPHRLTGYLREVAQAFHLFYHHCRVIGEDTELTGARLALAEAARLTLARGLALMDISAPERM